MRKLILKSVIVIAIAVLLMNCKTQLGISNGAYSDISLVRESKDYSIKRLKEVNIESKTRFGIPVDKSKNKKQGLIVRFNGINLSASKSFWPILTMVGLSLYAGSMLGPVLSEKIGYKKEIVPGYDYTRESSTYKLGLLPSFGITAVLSIPITGAINNLIWSGSAYKVAAFNANSKLLEENPNVDVFLNPKYEIETRGGIWTQKVKFKARVMGATIKED